MKKFFSSILFILTIIIVNNKNAVAQNPPAIVYQTPQVYTVGSTITPLSSTNTGGTASPANYGTPVSFTSYPTPFSVVIDASDNVYTTNNTTGDLSKFSSAGSLLFTVNTGAPLASAIAVDGLGNIFVSQFTSNSVLKYSSTGTLLATITGFNDPYGIAFDASNNAYVANYLSGDILEIVAGSNTATPYLTGFMKPYGLAIDAAGNMYVGEQGPGDIIKVAAGTLAKTTVATGFNGPRHLNKDSFGNIYVADFGNNAIKRISPSGVVTSILSTGLNSPRQAAFDSSGNLFVADYGSNSLLKSAGTSYAISTPLPAGLSFDTSTGQLTGTPTAVSAVTKYTITAYNTGGSSSTVLTLSVGTPGLATALAPTDSTLTPSSVTSTIANLVGFANPNGATTLVSFTYGTDPQLIGATTALADSNSSLSVGNTSNSSLVLSGLAPLTKYYYQVSATNPSGTTTGNILSFTTPASSNATLSSLNITNGAFTPGFSSSTFNYSIGVSDSTSTITLMPMATDINAKITVNGNIVASGTPSSALALNVGSNTITTVVTAQDGVTTQSYILTVIRQAIPASTTLSGLTISGINLNPVFGVNTNNYTASASNGTTSVTVTPSASDTTATVTVNGVTVPTGSTSANIPLAVGPNTVTVVVTTSTGTSNTYTTTITRAQSSNANLANISVSGGSLAPSFTPGTNAYTVNVSSTTTFATITPTLSDSTANVSINGTMVASGSASGPIALSLGTNTITALVTAQDGTTNTYTVAVVVTNAKPSSPLPSLSAISTLANLTINNGALAPAFTTSTSGYSVSVGNTTNSLTLTPTATDSTASVAVNGVILPFGTTSAPILLNVGVNTITTLVTAQNGTTNSYTITVTRAQSSVSTLANLTLSNGSVSPSFTAATSRYSANVGNGTSSITLTPATADSTESITVNGIPVSSGSASSAIPLSIGSNTITTSVTAQDGTTSSYIVIVKRAASSIATLASLNINNGSLTPSFTSGVTGYTTAVANGISSVTITPTTTDSTATVTVNGLAVSSGLSSSVALSVGNNTITTVVTAQDGTIDTYTLNITRAQSSIATLATLSVGNCSLSPSFSSGTTGYTASVGNAVTSVTFAPAVTDSTATVMINGVIVSPGSASSNISLNVGVNTITILVTAQDGTTNTYTTTITRAPSSIATLANLSLSNGSLAPSFATSTTSYSVTVGSATTLVTLTPKLTDSTATVTVNGVPAASGAASAAMPLNVGTNVITIVVTAQDGSTTDTYTTTVLRPSNDATLKQILVNGTLPQPTSNGLSNFTTSVSNSTNSITVAPTTNNPAATVTVNGIPLASGSASAAIQLNVGKNIITTVITAQDGTTIKTYSIVITRAPSQIAMLANLTLDNGTLSPAFASSTASYLTTVGSTISSIIITPTASDSTATVKVNGILVATGSASTPIALKIGINIISTIVTAQDGVTAKIYKIIVTRPASPVATLANLQINSGTLSPVFAGNVNVYTATVNSATSWLNVTPTASDPTALVRVNGLTVPSGSASRNIVLNVGSNVITTTVIAQDGKTVDVYHLTVNRPSADASMKQILVNKSLPHPVNNSNINFVASAVNTTDSAIVIPTPNNPNATVTVNGISVSNGTPSLPITLNVGPNVITTVITAQDGTTIKTYTVTMVRAASQIATLNNLTLSSGTLSPVFASATISYSSILNNSVSSVTVTPTAADTTAIVRINGAIVSSGTASLPILLKVGKNIITTVVTAQNGTTKKTYTIAVTRQASASIATLASLTLNGGATVTGFSPSVLNYKTAVVRTVSAIAVTPTTTDPYATLTINGAAPVSGNTSAPIALNAGNNTITIIVTAQDGFTKKTYTVIVNRQLPISNDASLASLTPAKGTASNGAPGSVVAVDAASFPVSGGASATLNSGILNIILNPGFNADTLDYSTTVDNAIAALTMTPVTSNANAIVSVNGTVLASGTTSAPMNLSIGKNIVTTVVTAEDGVTTRTYTLKVNRLDPTTADSTRTIAFNDVGAKTYGDADFDAGASASTSEPIIYNNYDPTVISVTNGKIHIIGAGTTTITATVAADKNYINSPTVTQTLVVNKAKQTISFSTVPTLQRGALYILSEATSSSKLPIIYKSSDSTIMSVKGSTLNLKQLGSAFLAATQPGDANYLPASAVNQLITIQDENNDKILVHQAVSPNGDGVNDFLLIEGIENYPGNKVAIINLNGETIYSTTGYNNSSKVFDGHSNINGRLQQPGTYFYMVEYTLDGQVRRKTGYFILKVN